MQIPETRYTRSGDVNIAYQVVGDGPLDLLWIRAAHSTSSSCGRSRIGARSWNSSRSGSA